MSLSNAYEEKRNFIRMKMDSPLSLTLSDKSVEGVCIDLRNTIPAYNESNWYL